MILPRRVRSNLDECHVIRRIETFAVSKHVDLDWESYLLKSKIIFQQHCLQ